MPVLRSSASDFTSTIRASAEVNAAMGGAPVGRGASPTNLVAMSSVLTESRVSRLSFSSIDYNMPGPPGPTGPAGAAGAAGAAGPPGSTASLYKFFTNETTETITVDLTDADLNKIWVLDLPNSSLDIRVPTTLLATLEQPSNSYSWQRIGWATLMKIGNGNGVARLMKPDGTTMINLLNNNIQTLFFRRHNTTNGITIEFVTYNNDGGTSVSL